MKKVYSLLGVCTIFAVIVCIKTLVSDSAFIKMTESIESLSNIEIEGAEKDEFRLKTVGCKGYRFDQWQPYCCDGYEECSEGEECDGNVFGC